MSRYRAFASSLLWLLGLSINSLGVQAVEFFDALADLTVGANLLEDLAGSVASATELPSLSDLGEALRQAAGFDPEQLQHLTPDQRQRIDLAQSFFLSPFGLSLDSMNTLPRLAANLTGSDSVSSRTTSSSSNNNSNNNSSSSSSSSSIRLPFSLRGLYGLDTSELERLAETIAEGVANSTSLGLRTMNPLALAASAAAAARKAANLASPSLEKREDSTAAASGTSPSPSAAAAAAVANLVEPLGFLNLHQQAALQKRQLELQAELHKTLEDLKNEKQLKEQLEKQQQRLEEQQQQLEAQQQLLQQQQLRQQLQQQLLLEQQKEQQLLAKSKETGSQEAAGSGNRGFFGVRLGSDDDGAAAAAATTTAGGSFGSAATEAAVPAAVPALAAAASKAALKAAAPAAESGVADKAVATGAAAAAAAADEGELVASITSGEAEAMSLGVASVEREEDDDEREDEETQTPPQRFWSRTNPLGPLQPASDMLYLLKWSVLNPLAILEWMKYSFGQCMDIYNDPDICANYLKVEPNSLNHGGLNNPWTPNTEA